MSDTNRTVAAAGRSPAQRIFDPTLVREADATRFLWGDGASGQVADLIYGRGERISGVHVCAGPRTLVRQL